MSRRKERRARSCSPSPGADHRKSRGRSRSPQRSSNPSPDPNSNPNSDLEHAEGDSDRDNNCIISALYEDLGDEMQAPTFQTSQDRKELSVEIFQFSLPANDAEASAVVPMMSCHERAEQAKVWTKQLREMEAAVTRLVNFRSRLLNYFEDIPSDLKSLIVNGYLSFPENLVFMEVSKSWAQLYKRFLKTPKWFRPFWPPKAKVESETIFGLDVYRKGVGLGYSFQGLVRLGVTHDDDAHSELCSNWVEFNKEKKVVACFARQPESICETCLGKQFQFAEFGLEFKLERIQINSIDNGNCANSLKALLANQTCLGDLTELKCFVVMPVIFNPSYGWDFTPGPLPPTLKSLTGQKLDQLFDLQKSLDDGLALETLELTECIFCVLRPSKSKSESPFPLSFHEMCQTVKTLDAQICRRCLNLCSVKAANMDMNWEPKAGDELLEIAFPQLESLTLSYQHEGPDELHPDEDGVLLKQILGEEGGYVQTPILPMKACPNLQEIVLRGMNFVAWNVWHDDLYTRHHPKLKKVTFDDCSWTLRRKTIVQEPKLGKEKGKGWKGKGKGKGEGKEDCDYEDEASIVTIVMSKQWSPKAFANLETVCIRGELPPLILQTRPDPHNNQGIIKAKVMIDGALDETSWNRRDLLALCVSPRLLVASPPILPHPRGEVYFEENDLFAPLKPRAMYAICPEEFKRSLYHLVAADALMSDSDSVVSDSDDDSGRE